MQEKDALRKKIKAQLQAIDSTQRKVWDNTICTQLNTFFHSLELEQGSVILAFEALHSEPQITAVFKNWEKKYKISYPQKTTSPEFFASMNTKAIFLPGLAFTKQGQRLGRGGGYYDRLLEQLPHQTIKVGICYDVQVLSSLPKEPHDQPVQFVITEHAIAQTFSAHCEID